MAAGYYMDFRPINSQPVKVNISLYLVVILSYYQTIAMCT